MKVNLQMNVATGTLNFDGKGLESANVQSIIDGMFSLHQVETAQPKVDSIVKTEAPKIEQPIVVKSPVVEMMEKEVEMMKKEVVAVQKEKPEPQKEELPKQLESLSADYDPPTADVDFDLSHLEPNDKHFGNPAVLVNAFNSELLFRTSYDCPCCKNKGFRWISESHLYVVCHSCETKIRVDDASEDDIIVFYRGMYFSVPAQNSRSVHFTADLEYQEQ